MLKYLVAALMAAGVPMRAQKQLGYPAEAKLLVIHADDLGLSHGVDRASFAALEQGAATAASVMVPCPWLTEVADYARAHPEADLGLHLTLTSEWKTYRWGPVAPASGVPGLLDPSGYLWSEVAPVVKSAKPEEVEIELRAQIERALKAGIRPTHLDSHMGTLFQPRFLGVYVKVARDYGLPFFMPRGAGAKGLLRGSDILFDRVAMATRPVKDWAGFYAGLVRSLKPGLTEMIVHLGYDDAELGAISEGHPDYGSGWRQRDFEVITSAAFRKALKENQVTLVGFKEIQAHWAR